MRNRIFDLLPCPSPEDWQALLAGDLSTPRISEMEAHLEGCLVCVAHLDALTPTLPEDLREAAREPAATTPTWADDCSRWTDGAASAEPAADGRLIFERKGKYQSHGRIAFGGMGEIYRARENTPLRRWVAIKIPSHARRSPEFIARFREEARGQAQLEHEFIARVYEGDEQDGVPYFSMELVDGETLAGASRAARLAPRRAGELMRQIASAVHYAHKRGVFHRDLKPANIMLTADGNPKIVDFGLARTLDEAGLQLSTKGAGTYEYMAPEQWEDDPEDEAERTRLYTRTDVYGLGAVLYELLTDRPPFRGANGNEIRRRVRFDEPFRPRDLRKEVPRDLETICLRCLSKRPEDRYATAEEVADALGRTLGGYPIGECPWPKRLWYFVRRHRAVTAAACIGLVLLAAALGSLGRSWWENRRGVALDAFEEGQKSYAEGRVTEGYNRMRRAIDLLPIGESYLRGYFRQNVASLRASLSHEEFRHEFPGEVHAAVASPDGRYVLAGDAAGTTTLWDLARDTTVELPGRADRQRVTAVAFDRTGTRCAAAVYGGDVTVWDVRSRQIIGICNTSYFVRCMAFLGDGGRLLTGTLGGDGPPLRMWDIRGGGKELRLDTGGVRPEAAKGIVVAPAGDRFVTVPFYPASPCRLWDAGTGRMVAELSEPTGIASSTDNPLPSQVAFSADGTRLAVAGARLTLYDGRTGAEPRPVEAGRWDRVHCVELRGDGGITLVVDARDATFARRMTPDLGAWDEVPLDRPENPDQDAAFTARGLILTGRRTPTLHLLRPPPVSLPHADLGADCGALQLAVSGDGSRFATLTFPIYTPSARPTTPQELRKRLRSRLQVWDGRTLRPISRIAELSGEFVPAVIAYGPSDDKFAVGGLVSDGRAAVKLVTLAPDGEMTFDTLGHHEASVGALAFTPDGTRLLSGSAATAEDGHAELACWDLNARSAPRFRVPARTAITTIAVSPDGSRFAAGGTDGVLRLFSCDRPSGAVSTEIIGTRIAAVAFAHTKPLLAVTQATDRVHVFEVSDTSIGPRAQFDQPGAAYSPVAFGQDDDALYVNGAGGVRVWDVETAHRLDPAITFVDRLETFALSSRPEAIIAVTGRGKLVLRRISKP